MNKIKKIIQCFKYRTVVLGKVGNDNHFDKGTRIESTTEIGDNNYFSFRVMCGNSRIGNYCSFGPDVKIGQSQHSLDYYTTSQKISSKCINFNMLKSPTIIENDVWVGANAVIMQGVKVGNGAVIGANAVVTKDIPEYGVAVGIPAKVIKYRLSEELRRELLNSKWWDMDADEVCRFFIQKMAEKDNI